MRFTHLNCHLLHLNLHHLHLFSFEICLYRVLEHRNPPFAETKNKQIKTQTPPNSPTPPHPLKKLTTPDAQSRAQWRKTQSRTQSVEKSSILGTVEKISIQRKADPVHRECDNCKCNQIDFCEDHVKCQGPC